MKLTKMPFTTAEKTPDQFNIERIIAGLDDIATGYEAKWGIGTLEQLAPPDLRAKWESQLEKLNAAIAAAHVPDLHDLAMGTMRGWAALEKAALQNGHAPLEPGAWEVRHSSGKVYRIVKNNRDASALHKPVSDKGAILTIEQLVNLHHAMQEGVLSELKTPGEKFKVEVGPYDPVDELPF